MLIAVVFAFPRGILGGIFAVVDAAKGRRKF